MQCRDGVVVAAVLAFAGAVGARASQVEVTGWQVNVRERPSRKAPVIINLRRGARLELVERIDSWFGVKLIPSGLPGYVHASLVRVVEDSSAPARAAPSAGTGEPPAPAPSTRAVEPARAPRTVPPAPAPTPRPAFTPLPPPPAAEQTPKRFGLGLDLGLRRLTAASRSAEAVFDGESSGPVFGGAARYAFTRSWFLGAGAHIFTKEGQRVFVADANSPVFRLGHPLKLRLIPAYAAIGYRFLPSSAFVPYLGLGGGVTFYREESTVGGVTEKETSSKATGIVLGGVEFVKGGLVLAIEGSWSMVPDSLGVGGVSAIYGETDIGGVTLVGRLGLVF